MQYKSNKGYTGIGQLGVLLFAIGIGLMVASILQWLLLSPLLPKGVDFENAATYLKDILANPEHVGMVRLINVVSAFVGFFLPAVLYSFFCNGSSFFWLGFSKHVSLKQLALVLPIVLFSGMFAATLHEWSEWILNYLPSLKKIAEGLEQNYDEQVYIIGQMRGPIDLMLVLVLLAFFPAFFEEVLFRGALQRLLERWWKFPLLAIVFTAVLFSLIHISISLFLSRAWLGFILGMLYFYTRNIWVPIFAHFFNNAIAVIQLYLMDAKKHTQMPADEVMESNWWIGILALGALFFLFRILKKHSEDQLMQIHTKEQVKLSQLSSSQNIASS
jgi:membrane protease YdiL (CAAX protease family)